jgi:nitroreductase
MENNVKIATTENPVIDLIKRRWSPRSFDSQKAITERELQTLIEAALWAPSANNEQPWQYIAGLQGADRFHKIWETLMPGNQPWCKNAAALLVSIARTTFATNEKNNLWAEHDLGLANAFLLLQATAIGIYCHPMAGFDKEKVINNFGLQPNQNPVCIIALGYLDAPEKLEEPYRSLETTSRTRKPISEILLNP